MATDTIAVNLEYAPLFYKACFKVAKYELEFNKISYKEKWGSVHVTLTTKADNFFHIGWYFSEYLKQAENEKTRAIAPVV